MSSIQLLEKPKRIARWRSHKQPVRVLVVGNNPIELGHVHDLFERMRDASYQVEFAFDLRDGFRRAIRQKPHAIVIDNNLSSNTIGDLVAKFSSEKRTSHLSLFLLAHEEEGAYQGAGITKMLPKDGLTPEILSDNMRIAVEEYSQAS
ncbi:MAG TPA: hypothetical protein DCE41_29645 [Cytophagales bacterium]|nr:hypothetical protein [Cytophagales bacterium]HAA21511.1 hypothetical protein [Cytophagales bacterium]HAP64644.1 hypothetical protein [Cytophagales bacterium]